MRSDFRFPIVPFLSTIECVHFTSRPDPKQCSPHRYLCSVSDQRWQISYGDSGIYVTLSSCCSFVMSLFCHVALRNCSLGIILKYQWYVQTYALVTKHHSTETLLVSLYNKLVAAVSHQRVSCLCLLDISAAFDTIDYNLLLHRLSSWFGISGTALLWFKSYLSSRSFSVKASNHP